MSKFEHNVIQFFIEKRIYIFFFATSIIALCMRYAGIDYVSNDMKGFLLPWYETIANNGSNALKDQVGDYGLLYQTIIFLLVKFPLFSADTKYKLVSIFFDFLLASCASYITCSVTNKPLKSHTGVITYFIVLLCPTVVFNSAYWGQCDSIFTCFCLLTFIFIMKGRFQISFFFYGIALAFKLQAIFFFPFILCHYIYTKRYSILNLFISLFTFWFSGIATYISGRNIFSAFHIYADQTQEYSQSMYINVASFWALIGQDSKFLKLYSILFTIAILGFGLYNLLNKKDYFNLTENTLYYAAWTTWTCVLFLPHMHERYTYLSDIFLISLAIANKKYSIFAIASVIISTMTYTSYLFVTPSITRISSLICISCWLIFSLFDFITQSSKSNKSSSC